MMNRTDKENYITGCISLISNKMTLFGDEILPDITYKQWFLLMMISRMDIEEKNLNRIAEFVGTTRQNIKKMLVPLERKGYVRIMKSDSDARALRVELTDKTYQYFSEHDASTANETNKLFAPFSPKELDSLIYSLKKLLCCFELYDEEKAQEEASRQ